MTLPLLDSAELAVYSRGQFWAGNQLSCDPDPAGSRCQVIPDHFPYPVNGPYVEEVEFRTPYEQIVRRSWENSAGYSAQQAQKDYAAQPNLVVVRVLIYLTPTYTGTPRPSGSRGQPGERPEDFWREFAIRVVQGQTIEPKKVSGARFRRGRGLGGAEVLLEFDAAQFDPGTVRVEVTGPDGKTLQAKFDLNPIR